jgi:hypothetical protein
MNKQMLTTILTIALCVSLSAKEKTVRVKVKSSSQASGYPAEMSMDGDTKTIWHSVWTAGATPHPHTLSFDLGASYEISGFSYTPRLDGCRNGMIRDYEIYLSNDRKNPGTPLLKGALPNGKQATALNIEGAPVKGRYVTLKVLSEQQGNNVFSSLSEFQIKSPGVTFSSVPALPELSGPALSNVQLQFNNLAYDLTRKNVFDAHAPETFNSASLILESDHDPLDIILRRTKALLEDIAVLKDAPALTKLTARLAALQKSASATDCSDEDARFALFEKAHALRRTIALSNPLLNFDKLLFIKRDRSTFNHMCDQYYGTFALPGGGVYALSNPFGSKPQVKNILANSVVENGRLKGQKLNKGGFLSPELSFDGKTILFAYVECEGDKKHIEHLDHKNRGHWSQGRCYHIFSANSDGTNLRQLTDGTWNDFDPCFIPNGRVAFISERRGGYLRCGRECPSYTVYDMNPDGSDIRVISPHENNEWQPSIDHNGMILYTRWDYVDRHGCTAHHPWVMTPDGRDSRGVHGNYSIKAKRADMEMDLRSIPGSNKIIGTAAPHHGQSYGSLVICDSTIPDDDAMAAVLRITPDIKFPESQGGKQVYGTPWPLNENYYLCVYDPGMRIRSGRQGGKPARGDYGIYLVDAFGNKILVYHDPDIASLSPMPLRSRKRPPVVMEKSQRLAKNPPAEGTMAVLDVYDSLKPWPEGTKIKALRLYQIFSMSCPSGHPPHETGRRINSASDSVNLARRVLGTVPVEDDGSAHFKVPALKEVYFQALDENGCAVQSMRSATWVQPGEQLTCIGCHEPKNRVPLQKNKMVKAMMRKPSIPKPDVDGTNPFSYPRLVQPVLDKNCVACHTKNKDKGAPPLDSGIVTIKIRRPTKVFRSYDSLIHKYAFWDYGDRYRTTPGKFGALASKLYPMLKKGHHDLKLSDDDMHRIIVWLDSVSNFYGVYEKEGGETQLSGGIAYPTLE